MNDEALRPLINLISGLLNGTKTPSAFEFEYMRLWRTFRDSGLLSHLNAESDNALDRVFTATDCYCADPSIRSAGDLDDEQFVEEVARIFRGLLASHPLVANWIDQ